MARSRRFWKGILIFLVVALLLFTPKGDRVLTPAEIAARGHEYGLVGWEVSNFLDKWGHLAIGFIPGLGSSEQERRHDLDRYLALNDLVSEAEAELNRAVAASQPDDSLVERLQAELDELTSERRGLRNDVEELLESTIDEVLDDLDLGELGPLTWPPVDFRLDSTPRVLVTSPRDRIHRRDSILIDADVTVADREEIESEVYAIDQDLSAIVLGTGGVATFPTVIPEDRDLLPTLEVAAHEWLHAYLIFKPFGRAYWSSANMTTLNETVADIFGIEVGRLTYERLTGETLPPADPFIPEPEPDPDGFSFREFMRETRLTTDEMLAAGEIEGAEAYMEQRRLELQVHGIYIRKINQAYFAFNGSYGDNPASVSPIGKQVEELRGYVENVGDLVKTVQDADSYSEFLEILQAHRDG